MSDNKMRSVSRRISALEVLQPQTEADFTDGKVQDQKI